MQITKKTNPAFYGIKLLLYSTASYTYHSFAFNLFFIFAVFYPNSFILLSKTVLITFISPSLDFYLLSFLSSHSLSSFQWQAAQHPRTQVEKVNSNFSVLLECADGRAEQTFTSITTKRVTKPALSPE